MSMWGIMSGAVYCINFFECDLILWENCVCVLLLLEHILFHKKYCAYFSFQSDTGLFFLLTVFKKFSWSLLIDLSIPNISIESLWLMRGESEDDLSQYLISSRVPSQSLQWETVTGNLLNRRNREGILLWTHFQATHLQIGNAWKLPALLLFKPPKPPPITKLNLNELYGVLASLKMFYKIIPLST